MSGGGVRVCEEWNDGGGRKGTVRSGSMETRGVSVMCWTKRNGM